MSSVLDGTSWMLEGLCAQVGGDSWFPEKGGSTQEAKRICMSCPVRIECLEDALARNERFGIAGGKSERERRKIAQDRARELEQTQQSPTSDREVAA